MVPNQSLAAVMLSASVCGSDPSSSRRTPAVPNRLSAEEEDTLYAMEVPAVVAAMATVRSASTRICWRHSRLNNRQAHRITARRAGTPPSLEVRLDATASRDEVMSSLEAQEVIRRR